VKYFPPQSFLLPGATPPRRLFFSPPSLSKRSVQSRMQTRSIPPSPGLQSVTTPAPPSVFLTPLPYQHPVFLFYDYQDALLRSISTCATLFGPGGTERLLNPSFKLLASLRRDSPSLWRSIYFSRKLAAPFFPVSSRLPLMIAEDARQRLTNCNHSLWC